MYQEQEEKDGNTYGGEEEGEEEQGLQELHDSYDAQYTAEYGLGPYNKSLYQLKLHNRKGGKPPSPVWRIFVVRRDKIPEVWCRLCCASFKRDPKSPGNQIRHLINAHPDIARRLGISIDQHEVRGGGGERKPKSHEPKINKDHRQPKIKKTHRQSLHDETIGRITRHFVAWLIRSGR